MNLHEDFPYPLYLVLSEQSCLHHSFLKVAELAIKGGVDLIQLREKKCSTAQFTYRACQLKEVASKYGIPIIINDNLQVAHHIDAAGVHVGTTDVSPSAISNLFPNKLIGYSIENLTQFQTQEVNYAHHFGISPVFNSATKRDTLAPWGIDGIKQIRLQTQKPLIGIGDMNLKNIKKVLDAGVNSIAVASAICSSKDPYKESILLKELILGNII